MKKRQKITVVVLIASLALFFCQGQTVLAGERIQALDDDKAGYMMGDLVIMRPWGSPPPPWGRFSTCCPSPFPWPAEMNRKPGRNSWPTRRDIRSRDPWEISESFLFPYLPGHDQPSTFSIARIRRLKVCNNSMATERVFFDFIPEIPLIQREDLGVDSCNDTGRPDIIIDECHFAKVGTCPQSP